MKGFKKEGKKELEGFLEGNCNKVVSQFPLMLCCTQNTSFSKMHSSDFSAYSLLKCFVWFSHDGMLLQLLHNDPHLQLLQTHVPVSYCMFSSLPCFKKNTTKHMHASILFIPCISDFFQIASHLFKTHGVLDFETHFFRNHQEQKCWIPILIYF